MSQQKSPPIIPDKHEKDLKRLKRYAERKGWLVFESDENSASVTTKTVRIKRKATPETKVYFLMHELGHLALHERLDYQTKFGIALKARSDSNPHRTTRVYEEFEAWNAGEEIASMLKIELNQEKFARLKARCLMTYLEWACRPKLLKHEKYEQKLNMLDDSVAV